MASVQLSSGVLLHSATRCGVTGFQGELMTGISKAAGLHSQPVERNAIPAPPRLPPVHRHGPLLQSARPALASCLPLQPASEHVELPAINSFIKGVSHTAYPPHIMTFTSLPFSHPYTFLATHAK